MVLAVVSTLLNILEVLPEKMKGDKEVVMAALNGKDKCAQITFFDGVPPVLEWIAPFISLWDDKEFVVRVAELGGWLGQNPRFGPTWFKLVSERLRGDKEVVILAGSTVPSTLNLPRRH